MQYDMDSSDEPNHCTEKDANEMFDYYNSKVGISSSKIVYGVPFYAKARKVSDDISYRKLITYYTVKDDINYAEKNHRNNYYYDNRSTISSKVSYAMSVGAAGIMSWDLGQDLRKTDKDYYNLSLLQKIRDKLYGGASAPRYYR